MLTHHRTFNAISRIDFQPETFTPGDLLWLPHHAQLASCARKRQTEHLAGRIAAVYALRDYGEKSVPGIGEQRQPLWPGGLYGSISHCGHTAIAVVARAPVGVDIESRFSHAFAGTVANDIATEDELAVLRRGPLDFPLALTLAFSAKESLYKALSATCPALHHFHAAQVIALDAQQLTVRIPALNLHATVAWFAVAPHAVITLYHPSNSKIPNQQPDLNALPEYKFNK